MNPLKTGRQLRFRYDPAPDESAIGAFVAACRAQWLRSTGSGLEGAGLRLARPGFLQLASGDELVAASWAMRTEPELLAACAFSASDRRDRIALGDLVMPRAAFEFGRRRIGPGALVARSHHRAAWLNLLLPYCPETLELLVQDCVNCGQLGWRHTRGIAHCESCGERIPPATEAPLDPTRSDDYRLMARLMSRDPEPAADAIASLPSAIREASRTALVCTGMRASIMFGTGRVTKPFTDLVSRTPEEIAAVVCDAARLLRGWPASIRDAAAGRIAAMGDDLAAYRRFRRDLRIVADADDGVGRELMAMAFPVVDGRSVATLANDTAFYSPVETSRILLASSAELRELRRADAIGFDKMPSGRQVRARYAMDDVDEIARQVAGSVAPETGAIELDVPVYAMGQFVADGLLGVPGHPAVSILRGHRVMIASVQELRRTILDARATVDPPAATRLCTALLRRPGEKPWVAAVRALIRGDVAFSLPNGPFSIRELLVDPNALAELGIVGPTVGDPLGLDRVSMRDACEMAGAPHLVLARALSEAGIRQERVGRAKGVDRAALRELLGDVVFMGEIVAVTGRKPVAQSYELRRIGAVRRYGAWCRWDLITRRILLP